MEGKKGTKRVRKVWFCTGTAAPDADSASSCSLCQCLCSNLSLFRSERGKALLQALLSVLP